MIQTTEALAARVPMTLACAALGYPRSSYYRQQQEKPAGDKNRSQRESPRALPASEREVVRETLNSERFVDCSPRQVYGTLLDEGEYLCSVSTMYRILRAPECVRGLGRTNPHPRLCVSR